MTKQESLEFKGIAILLMLFLHLFNTQERVAECTTFINFWNHKPLVFALSRVGSFCVPLYIFLSGYGLFTLYEKTQEHTMSPIRRSLKLLLNYWVVFAIFIPMGCIIAPEDYSLSTECILNFTTLINSYNNEWWFLFPYLLLVFTCKPFFRIIAQSSQKRAWTLISITAIGYFLVYFLHFNQLGLCMMRIEQYFTLLFPFLCGAVFAKYQYIRIFSKQIMSKSYATIGVSLSLIIILLLRMTLGASILSSFIILFVIPLYLALPRGGLWQKMLRYFGKHSTNMWLTHTFFAYYLFHDYIYGLKYPPVMYITLVAASLLSSYIVDFIYQPLQRWLMPRLFSSK